MGKKVGSDANDDMKYVRNNLYGYGYLEEQYLAPTKNMNDLEDDISNIIEVNDEQSEQIQSLFQQILDIMSKYLSREVADELYGASLEYNALTGELKMMNADGEQIGETVIIHEGTGGIVINSIELVNEDDHGNTGFFLKFNYTITDTEGHSTDVSVYADITELEDVYKAGNGIAIESGASGNTVSVVVADNDYIEVGESGITTNGLNAKITELDEKVAAVNPGLGLITHNTGEMAVGNYNVSVEGETLFSVGNGTSDENRSNAFEVKSDGTIWMNVEGEYMEIGRLLSMLAHETY